MYRDNLIGANAFGKHFSVKDKNRSVLQEQLILKYNHDEQTLYIKWEGEVSSNELRQGYAHIMNMVLTYKPQKWIMDLQNRLSIEKEDQQWVFKYIFPQVLRAVNKNVFVAIVMPVFAYNSLVNEIDGDELMDGDNFMIIHHFLYQEESRRWLLEMAETDLKIA
ncbi:hypothetical protein [Pontibacter amylolyticus]|uniref:STAS/SEC14 domain-containing protein n=1 Tax=Pontibacter amylolyticus TaxID=1424080 RepID=A0ABQ1VXW6_9BACT|nr:hypothetical protein [Pontibacter amylolyticus]GGG01548.1 hypothetical protein GCM10011323_03030 [Pontibacter amylolyticus]